MCTQRHSIAKRSSDKIINGDSERVIEPSSHDRPADRTLSARGKFPPTAAMLICGCELGARIRNDLSVVRSNIARSKSRPYFLIYFLLKGELRRSFRNESG